MCLILIGLVPLLSTNMRTQQLIKEAQMAKVSKKAKSIKKEIKARKTKVQKQEGKIKKLKKSLK